MTIPFAKPATTFPQQVSLLKQRGMTIDDSAEAEFYLRHLNYYRLGAYWLPFESDHTSHQFRSNTHFNDVLNLYIFDRELRLLVLDAIERIEVSVRCQWAYCLAHNHGTHAHLDATLAFNRGFWQSNLDKLTSDVQRSDEVFMAKSNNELERFAYVASHDLQEPLRKIISFGDRLRESAENALDQNCLSYLSRMQSSAVRMKLLISDLLVYSKLPSSGGKSFDTVSLNDVMAEVVSNLELRIEQNNGEVIFSNLPEVKADRMQMSQLFQNLIGNGLKYRKKDVNPVVKVSCVAEGGVIRILVEDNGIGFEQEYAEQIFEPFLRLHSKSEYEGTGMGLAICKKIVEHHGWTISVDSKPNVGATFCVTLPAAS